MISQPQALTLEQASERWLPALEGGLLEPVSGGLLHEMASHHLNTGGKRLRALTPLWLCHSLGGNAENAIPLGLCMELLHNGTLVHDDLQDGDTVRRGKPTVWAKWGSAQAINVGDALYFQAMAMAGQSPVAGSLISPIGQALFRVVQGQVMELQLQLPETDKEHLSATQALWMKMARGKTGALFGICLRAGAEAAHRSDLAQACQEFGEQMGLLFQVQDDYLDLVGDKGRNIQGSDLAEGKLSFPVVLAMESEDSARVSKLLNIIKTPREACSEQMVKEGVQLLDEIGALAATAQWLRSTRDELASNPINQLLPGLLDRVLKPVAHAL